MSNKCERVEVWGVNGKLMCILNPFMIMDGTPLFGSVFSICPAPQSRTFRGTSEQPKAP